MRLFQFLITFCLALCFVSCEKDVNIKLDGGTPKLVVDGQIGTGEPPIVVLTKSIGYFNKIDLNTVAESFLHDLHVTVSDGTQTITLREYNLDTAGTNFVSIYTLDTTDPSSFNFLGREDTYYTLTVDYEGTNYTSTTKIPRVKPLDSIFAKPPVQAPANNPSALQLFVRYSDPDTVGNRVRYFIDVNGSGFIPGLGTSVYEDNIINGTTFNINVAPDVAPGSQPNFDSTGYVYPGDKINVRWCAIDRPVYLFWSTFEFATGSVGNPFSSPVQVTSNISNGALGNWSGYGVSYIKLDIPL